MCVHWECVLCQCQILVLVPAYPTVLIYVTELEKFHVCPLGMCVVLVPNIGISTSISNATQYTPTDLRKLHVCPLGMCVLLVPHFGISTGISNNIQIRPQHLRNFMCVLWECAWCQCQILVLAPAYPTLHKYTHSTYEISCVSTRNVRGASAKYWYQHQHIQHYTYTSQYFRNFMCVHWECAWCYCQILILAPAYPTIHIYVTALEKLHVCPLGMCVVLVPKIRISTSISNTTQIHPQDFRNIMCVLWECAWCQCQILVLAPAYRTLLIYVTALEKLHVFPLGMCVVLVPNIGIRTSIFNTTQILSQHFRNSMYVHWECVWCQCQMLVLAPAYPTLHKYAHRPSETS